jgi:chromosome segregation protein
VLEGGIEIVARPHGKRWLSLSLLSGGERSLTALGLLFALQSSKPSPFCFLDEVDAALDEANVARFSNLLREFSKKCQMLVITHNKKTMAEADLLYGVTMEEPGVSKIVSMKMEAVHTPSS